MLREIDRIIEAEKEKQKNQKKGAKKENEQQGNLKLLKDNVEYIAKKIVEVHNKKRKLRQALKNFRSEKDFDYKLSKLKKAVEEIAENKIVSEKFVKDARNQKDQIKLYIQKFT